MTPGSTLFQTSEHEVQEQAREILRYFLNHPEVDDSLEGIARWRLLQQQICRTVEQVHRALDLLVKLGLLRQRSTTACGQRYSINPTRIADCRRLLGGDGFKKWPDMTN